MTFTDLTVREENKICTITLTREQKFNSFRQGTYSDLQQALESAAEDDNVAITVLTGQGKFFSSGADFTEERDPPKTKHEAWVKFRTAIEFATAAVTRAMMDHPKPLVVLLNGPVIGYPAGMIANADLIYAKESAYLFCPFSTLGLCAEGGASLAFVQRMGLGAAQEALLFARKFGARELEKLGFVNRVFSDADFEVETKKILQTAVKTCNPVSMQVTKKLIRSAYKDQQYKTLVLETDALTARYMSGDPATAFRKLMERNAAKSKL
ncbi:ClpP/crotonase-like domain-containing protein [Phlyctochytrium arcticum]|nr:ClpP/crotonase-like domain-containing protein [Phlyctochytrium arcticum]